jgi:hypothetical protein
MSVRKILLLVAAVLVLLPLGAWLAARRALASDFARSTLERQLSAHLGRPVHVGFATAAIFPHIAVDLRDVTIGETPPVAIARIQVRTGLRSLLTRTISDAAIRSLAFRGIVLGAGDQTLTIDLDSSLSGDRLDISRLVARARATRIEASGALTSLTRMEGAFDLKADPLDLAEMIALGSAIAPSEAHSGAGSLPMHLSLTVAAPRVQFGGYGLRELSMRADVRPGHVALDDLGFQIFGGSFHGRLGVDTGGATPSLRLNGQLAGLDVAQVLNGSGSPGGLTGRLGGSLALQGDGADAATLLRTSRGTIAAIVADGALPHLDMIRQVVLAFGKPSGAPPEGAGTSFQTLGGTFVLASAALTSDTLALKSRDADVDGRGSLRLDSGAVNVRADVVLSPELTAQSGTDLRRYAQENGRVTVPAAVSGTLEAPAVSIDVAAAARRALGNELQRRATDFLGGLFKKKKGGGP